MFKIIKYDFLKKYKLLLITIISSVLLNLFLVVKLGVSGSISFLAFFPMAMIFLYIGDIIKMYSDDLNKKSGYMLFMTSNSGYKIIVSKVVTAILEGLSILLLYMIFIIINSIYISTAQGFELNVNIAEVINAVNLVLSGNLGFNLGHVFVFLLTAFVVAINFILTAYTAITIRKSLFSEVKLGGFLSFVIFVGLNWATSFTTGKLTSVVSPYYDNVTNFGNIISATELVMILLPVVILSAIESVIMIIGSGYLLEKKINL